MLLFIEFNSDNKKGRIIHAKATNISFQSVSFFSRSNRRKFQFKGNVHFIHQFYIEPGFNSTAELIKESEELQNRYGKLTTEDLVAAATKANVST